MKRIVFISILAVWFSVGKSEQRFFPANSIRCINAMIFNYVENTEGDMAKISPDTVYIDVWTGNDTIVDGKECVVLWEMYDRDLSEYTYIVPVTPNVPLYCGVIYEAENGYVYFKSKYEGSEWTILYDFSKSDWEIGGQLYIMDDEFDGPISEPITNLSTYTLCNGEDVAVANNLIYGIGYNNWPFLTPLYEINPYIPVEIPVAFYRNGELLWKNTIKQNSIAIDGKEWKIETRVAGGAEEDYIDGRYTRDVHMWIDGDTIVDNIVCKRLYTHTKELWSGGKETLEVGYCRQDGDKYYQNGELMFDFSLQVGDVFVPEKGEPLTVKSIGDTILADGVSRKYLLMVEDMNAEVTPYNSDYWVEGIGSLRMGIYTNDFSGAGLVKILQSCVYNDKTIYRKAPYLVTEGKQWAVCRHSFTGYWTETYRLQGDTVINGKAYKIEHASRNEDLSDMKPSGRYMREEDGRVYSITDKDQRDDFVFDYSMEIGDTLFYDSYFDYYGNEHKHSICLRLIAIRDTIMPNGDGRVRKCYDTEAGHLNNEGIYEFYPDERAFPYSFIEDIGYTDTGLSSSEIGTTGVGYSLLYVKQGDTMLYQQEEGVLWRDNTSVEAIKADKTNTFYYDLQGRPVADPTRGIYIKDGKKAFVSKR